MGRQLWAEAASGPCLSRHMGLQKLPRGGRPNAQVAARHAADVRRAIWPRPARHPGTVPKTTVPGTFSDPVWTLSFWNAFLIHFDRFRAPDRHGTVRRVACGDCGGWVISTRGALQSHGRTSCIETQAAARQHEGRVGDRGGRRAGDIEALFGWAILVSPYRLPKQRFLTPFRHSL